VDTLLTFLLSLAAGLMIIIGGLFFSLRARWNKTYLDIFIAFGAGYILAVALVDVLPEAIHHTPHVMAYVLVGYLIVHIFEHVLTPHFHYGEETHDHLVSHAVSTSALIGLIVHNFFSGLAIGSGMLVDMQMGLVIFIGIILHKVPEGFTISSIMFVAWQNKKSSSLATILLALSSLLGTGFLLWLDSEDLDIKGEALALSAGTFIHIATTDLIPKINERDKRWLSLVVLLGAGVAFAVSFLFKHN